MKIVVPRNRIHIAEEYMIRLDKVSDDAKSELDAATRRWYRATKTQENDMIKHSDSEDWTRQSEQDYRYNLSQGEYNMIKRVSSNHPDFENEEDDDIDYPDHPDDLEPDEDEDETLSLPSARLVIGVRLDDSQLYRLEMRGLKHHCPQTHIHPPQTEGLYCMWCGKPMAVDKVQVSLFDKSSLRESPVMTASLASEIYTGGVKLDVVWGRDSDEDLFAIVGYSIAISDNPENILRILPSHRTIDDAHNACEIALGQWDLWDEDNFGVWLFTLH